MNKTLNQRIYETPGDIKKAIYDSGYEAGKKTAAEQIFADIEREVRENSDDWCYQPKAELLDRIVEFKEKYGVK